MTQPLRDIPAVQLFEYAYSAMFTVGSVDDYRYLLPRLVEVAAEGSLGAPDLEVVFSQINHGRWESWTMREQDGLRAFAFAIGEWLSEETLPRWNLDSWICALGQFLPDLEGPLQPLLRDTPAARTNLISYFERHERDIRRGTLDGVYWKDDLPAKARLLAWLRSEPVTEALGRAYLAGSAG